MAKDAGTESAAVMGAITGMSIDELVSKLAIGIAQGQKELDLVCMDLAREMGDAQIEFGKKVGADEPDVISLIELGFTPNFYQFVDTILEVRVAISSQFEETEEINTSEKQAQLDEQNQQQSYESRKNAASSRYSYGRYAGVSYNRGYYGANYGVNYGGYGSSSYGSSASRYGSSSSFNSKSLQATTVDAKYASTYNYSVEASSMIKTKIVPVPPPAVLEEKVRAKAEERKEYEKWLRLLRQVKGILPGMVSSIDSTVSSELLDDSFSVSDLTHGKALKLQEPVLYLKEDYDGLTTDHWTVITKTRDRNIADKHIGDLVQSAGQLVNFYEKDPSDTNGETFKLKSGVTDTELEDCLKDIKKYLDDLRTKVEEIQKRLPLTPEEEAAEQMEKERKGEE